MSSFVENLKWLQSNIDKSIKGVESLINGIIYCQLLNLLNNSLMNQEQIRIPTKSYNDQLYNLNLLVKSLSSISKTKESISVKLLIQSNLKEHNKVIKLIRKIWETQKREEFELEKKQQEHQLQGCYTKKMAIREIIQNFDPKKNHRTSFLSELRQLVQQDAQYIQQVDEQEEDLLSKKSYVNQMYSTEMNNLISNITQNQVQFASSSSWKQQSEKKQPENPMIQINNTLSLPNQNSAWNENNQMHNFLQSENQMTSNQFCNQSPQYPSHEYNQMMINESIASYQVLNPESPIIKELSDQQKIKLQEEQSKRSQSKNSQNKLQQDENLIQENNQMIMSSNDQNQMQIFSCSQSWERQPVALQNYSNCEFSDIIQQSSRIFPENNIDQASKSKFSCEHLCDQNQYDEQLIKEDFRPASIIVLNQESQPQSQQKQQYFQIEEIHYAEQCNNESNALKQIENPEEQLNQSDQKNYHQIQNDQFSENIIQYENAMQNKIYYETKDYLTIHGPSELSESQLKILNIFPPIDNNLVNDTPYFQDARFREIGTQTSKFKSWESKGFFGSKQSNSKMLIEE